jgi:hypothetical protein
MITLPKHLIPIRKEIYKDAWKKYKARGVRLTELAKIFRVDPAHLFYILKEENEKSKGRK